MKSIGLDVGTTTICGILMDSETGEMIKKITLPNDTAIESGKDFEKMQDAEKIEEKCLGIAKALTKDVEDLVSIGVTGQMHGILYVDKNGNAVSPLMTWQDERGNLPSQSGKSYAKELSELTGYYLATGFGTVTHYYNKKNNLVPEAAVTFCTIPDYISMRLAGLQKPILHASMAASLGLFSVQQGAFDCNAIEKSGMEISFFPDVQKEEVSIGIWREGVKVSQAFGDNQASFLGSVDDQSHVLVNVGTGSQLSVLGTDIREFDHLECRPFMKGYYLYVGAPLCGGYGYALLKTFFEGVFEMCGEKPAADIYQFMNEAGRKSKDKGVSLLVDTRFRGTRKDPKICGKIENITPYNFEAGAMVYGFLEGICQELLDLYQEYEDTSKSAGGDVSKEVYRWITGSGNGIRKNPLLQEIICEKFSKDMKIPLYAEEASYGSALFSLYVSGYYKNLKELQEMIGRKNIMKVNKDHI